MLPIGILVYIYDNRNQKKTVVGMKQASGF